VKKERQHTNSADQTDRINGIKEDSNKNSIKNQPNPGCNEKK